MILAAAVVSLLMVAASQQAKQAVVEVGRVKSKEAVESAIEVVTADILFNGARSRWWILPATGHVTIDGREVSVSISSENGRLDVNSADLESISAVLGAMQSDISTNANFLREIELRRAENRMFRSLPELEASLARSGFADPTCKMDPFTLFSGLAKPSAQGAQLTVAKALGGQAEVPGEVPLGNAIRVRASFELVSSTSIVRITGQRAAIRSLVGYAGTSACLH